MQAVTAAEPGGPDALGMVELPDPTPSAAEVLIDVAACGVNRADLLQRQGFYPPPPGESEVIGLECSGTIAAVGPEVTGWAPGDRVCALLAGGGYASQVVVPAGQVMPVPAGVDLVSAAALPEVACTVWSNVFMVAGLRPKEVLLVHGGAGGIGTFALQLGRAFGARVLATAGTPEKRDTCLKLGAEVDIDYRNEDFVEVVRELNGGADVILDNMGAKYLSRNIAALAYGGRLVVIGLQGGTRAELDLAALLATRGAVIASSLRARPRGEKAAICSAVVEHVWPLVEHGDIRPVVHLTLPLPEAAAAHTLMAPGAHTGKILLTA
jgi:putative PIG3 family NAD(P)H quinone oxidoreductase